MTFQQQDMLQNLAQNPVKGMTPVIIGTGDAIKVALMPTAGVPGKPPGLTIQQYVQEGQTLHERIMKGEMQNVPHSKVEVAKLMWFLQALGSSKASESSGQHPPSPALFKEGAFSIEDPDHRLEQFLFTANSYPRASSHLKEFQDQPGCEPRGTDVRGVPMPNNRKTVMFARMPGATEVRHSRDPNMGQKGMLFLKMEPHGCRGLSFKGTGRTGDGAAGAAKSVKRFFANIKDFLGHGLGFLQSVGQRGGALAIQGQNNRERISSDVKNLYTDITNHAKALKQLNLNPAQRKAADDAEALLGQGKPLSSTGGIRVMIRNLETVQKQLEAVMPAGANNPEALTFFTQRLTDALSLLRNHGDYPDMRIGNEVILMQGDTKIGNAVSVQMPEQPVTQQGTLDKETQEVSLAGYRYQLANLDNVNIDKVVHGFDVDCNRTTIHIGPSGQETPVAKNPEGAKAALLTLAGNNERIAKALMLVAQQGIGAPLTSAIQGHAMKSVQCHITPERLGHLHISGLPDGPDGAKVFRVGLTFDNPMGNHDGVVVSLDDKEIRTDQQNSRVSGQTWLDVTFHENGVIEPKFHGDPSYAFTFVPAPPQPAPQH